MPFPPPDKKPDAPAHSTPDTGHQDNPHHNAPMPSDRKADLAKHDVSVNDCHTNHGDGHH